MLPRSATCPARSSSCGSRREHRRRVAAGGRRLAGRQADLALGHGHAGQAVHHQQDVAAAVAEPLGDPGGDEGRRAAARAAAASEVATTTTERARPSGPRSCSRNSRTSRPRSPTRASTETSALGAAGDHRQQARLADAGAGEDADALAAAAGHERVEGAHAERQLGVDAGAAHGRRGRALDTGPDAGRAGADRRRSDGRGRRARGRAGRGRPARSAAHRWPRPGSPTPTPAHRSERHAGGGVAVQRDDLGERSTPASPSRLTAVADGGVEPGDVHAEPDRAGRPDRSRPGRRPASAAAGCRVPAGCRPGGRSRDQHLPEALERRAQPRRRSRAVAGLGDSSRRARPSGRRRRVTLPPARAPREVGQGGDVVGVEPHGGGRLAGAASARARRTASSAGAAASSRLAADDDLGDADGHVGDRAVQLRQDRRRRGRPAAAAARRSWSSACDHCRSPLRRGLGLALTPEQRLLVGPGHGLGTSGLAPLAVAPLAIPRARPGARRRRRPPRAPGRPAGGRRRTGPRTGWCAGRRRCVQGGHPRRTDPAGRRCGGPQTTKSSSIPSRPRSGRTPRACG